MLDAQYFRDLSDQCTRMARQSYNLEVALELRQLAQHLGEVAEDVSSPEGESKKCKCRSRTN